MPVPPSEPAVAEPPDPGSARTLDDLAETLRSVKLWAADPSYETITARINAAWRAAGRPPQELARKGTVVDCFKAGRRRVNVDLVIAVVQALHPDAGYVTQWQQALRVVLGESRAAAQVRVSGALPPDLAEFTGRSAALDHIYRTRRRAAIGCDTVVISAIEGMAGVGKTQLAVHAGHRLAREEAFERVLFVNLRGFHPDPALPPADPAAVLDGFLSLLGVPGQQIPYDLAARTAMYRRLLAGRRALVILDNAADAEQVRPLLPETPGCLVLITSRRSLAGLRPSTHLAVDAFTPPEALLFLARAAPDFPAGDDPDAAARIASRCGHLPLALGLVVGHMRAKSGWTLTDHADWLDERHSARRLDTGVELALDLSYQHLTADRQRLLRLLALHPGHDLDPYAAAALIGAELATADADLRHLGADHLLQQSLPARYAFHDLVRAYATAKAHDEDRSADRRAALTRLFDHYLGTAAAAMDTLHPAEAHLRPRIRPAGTPAPDLTAPPAALAWLDAERVTLVAVAGHTAAYGWPTHTDRLARTLFRYLEGGHLADAVTVHGHAHRAARDSGDPAGQAHALAALGVANGRLGRYPAAAEHLGQALELFEQVGDQAGQARALNNLGTLAMRSGGYPAATGHYTQALALHRQTGTRTGEATTLSNLGLVEARQGRYPAAAGHFAQALALCRQTGDRTGEADTLDSLGDAEVRAGRYGSAGEHLRQALALFRRLGNRAGEGSVLDTIGTLYTRTGQWEKALEHHRQALAIFRASGDRDTEAWVLNGLGEAFRAAGRPADALTHHGAAHAIAADIGDSEQQARAHAGIARAHDCLGDPDRAREHYHEAMTRYSELHLPEADELRARLATIHA
ncbi:MAG: hypothetical protein QOE51_421 [Actinoplanes sp.]|jgi:tetratricopeptide (TPR) repeat protein|nr:hypothetical protein [Actinoplanes sp.]